MQYLLEVRKRDREGVEPDYAWDLPAVARLDRLPLHSPVTFFVGENGSGKSTLLEAIALAWGFNPEGGSLNFSFQTRNTHSRLYEVLGLSRSPYRPKDGYFLRAESFYNMASYVDQLERDGPPGFLQGFGGRSLHAQSHGESFLALAVNRFRGQGLYLLDEPEAALSPARQLSFLARLHELVRADSQLIIATHSPILMAYPGAELLQFGLDGRICPVDYRETEHYQVTRSFLEHPERMLRILLEQEEDP